MVAAPLPETVRDEIIRLYQAGLSTHETAKRLGVSQFAVWSVVHKCGVARPWVWPEKIHEEIIRLYRDEGLSIRQIAKRLNIHHATIYSVLKRHGIGLRSKSEALRQYAVNENYFDAIDSPDKAYWLGLLYADGCVVHKNRRHLVQLALKIDDAGHVEKFRAVISSEAPIVYHDDEARLVVCSVRLTEALEKCGCVQCKSLMIKFPWDIVPEHLYSHFIRGYFDGDGTLSRSRRDKSWRSWNWSMVSGSYEFLEAVQKVLMRYCGVGKTKIVRRNASNCWRLQYGGRCQVARILDWLYKDSTPETRLDRKYNLYLRFREEVGIREGLESSVE
ncbi:hypothetical protein Desku_1120 [Desulfofundulus kuznetsovii DSM 6115]|uniref:DOD-type homing endonuclease domain-containing protein n=1 Tax=Desulfofundulus kuznetsovii (strain DSM 6115 / VKM B-1805 / 17) TaxID=760568 RepID=A0AAU8PFZ1_DESK7|nr:hypothetical protein Desku_1120 [Desulfofundulus kuznetsovii DSM 6115]